MGDGRVERTADQGVALPAFLLAPVAMVIAYNVARIVSTGFVQLRDSWFASVGQYAVRRLAYRTFVHLHELSLRFHLERRTGGLSRVIERGTKGIESIVRFTILGSAPTMIEFAFTAAVFGLAYGWRYLPSLSSRSRSISGSPSRPATGASISAAT